VNSAFGEVGFVVVSGRNVHSAPARVRPRILYQNDETGYQLEHPARVVNKLYEQGELGTRQRHLTAVAIAQRAAGQVDGEAVKGEDL
jgi:hypothetical protein